MIRYSMLNNYHEIYFTNHFNNRYPKFLRKFFSSQFLSIFKIKSNKNIKDAMLSNLNKYILIISVQICLV